MGIEGVLVDEGAPQVTGAVAQLVGVLRTVDPPVEVAIAGDGPDSVPDGVVVLTVGQLGLDPGDPRVVAMAAAGVGCHLRELVVVTAAGRPLQDAAERCGCRRVLLDERTVGEGAEAAELVRGAIEAFRAAEQEAAAGVGAPPMAEPWPDDPRLDPSLLRSGDRRNVVDRFRYWSEAAIIDELDRTRLPVHVAVENWQHDLNIGTVVRNANAFNVAGVHIVGKRRWNRRGAMATDRYLTVRHHESVSAFASWAADAALAVVGIDNVDGAVALEDAALPDPCVLVFGQEGPGLSDAMVAACSEVREITQHGSTRSINAGVASGVALHWWATHRS